MDNMDMDDFEDGQVLSSEEEDDEVVLETSAEDLTPLKMPEEPEKKAKFESPGGAIMGSYMDEDSSPFSDDFDYNILERPKTITREIRVAPSSSTTSIINNSSTSQNSTEDINGSGCHLQQPPESLLQDEQKSTIIIDDDFFNYNDDEFTIPQGSCSQDSRESNIGDVKRYKMDKSRPTVSARDTRFCPSSSTSTTFNQMAGKLQKNRKVNNIWNDLVLNDAVSESLDVLNKGPRAGQLADRGPESYFTNYRPAPSQLNLNSRKRQAYHSSTSGEESGEIDDKRSYHSSGEHAGEVNVDDNNDPGYISESGLSLYSYNMLKEKEEEERSSSGYEVLKCEKNTYWRKFESDIKSFKPKQLVNYIIRKLNEPKSDIIHRSIELLGREMVTKLFIKTMKIQNMGGMFVADRERKRTTGGIYFYLLQKYPGLDKAIVDKIFENDKQSAETKQKNKEKKKLKKMNRNLASKAFK